ncbi:hypothetical protein ACWEP8_01490 [Streptomyces hydrogenans]
MTITLAEELVPLSPDDGSGEAKERRSAAWAGEGVREAIRDMGAAMASVTVATIVAATA